jgi:hypothetical protein
VRLLFCTNCHPSIPQLRCSARDDKLHENFIGTAEQAAEKLDVVSFVSGHEFTRADGSRFTAGFSPCMPCAAAKAVLFAQLTGTTKVVP